MRECAAYKLLTGSINAQRSNIVLFIHKMHAPSVLRLDIVMQYIRAERCLSFHCVLYCHLAFRDQALHRLQQL